MLDKIREKLGGLVGDTWIDETTTHGKLVKLYRDYAEGHHRSFLTTKQRRMLNISSDATEETCVNYADLVVSRMNDRLTLSGIDGDSEGATAWANTVHEVNRFDGLSMDVNEAAIRDGVTYLLTQFDNVSKLPILAHELAWDGTVGMIAVYDRMGKTIVAAVKVWYEGAEDARRVNFYYPDRIEKYSTNGDGLTPLAEPGQSAPGVTPWVDKSGKPIGMVPVVAVVNRAKTHRKTGISELAAVIPLNDALNRTLVDMIMTSGLTAFQIRYAFGFDPGDAVEPGGWIIANKDGLTKEQQVQVGTLEQGQLAALLDHALFLIDQIGEVSQTPLRTAMGSDAQSGEALKQRESGLLSKVRRFQVKGGNAWEDVMAVAATLQAAFGTANTGWAKTRWAAVWKDAQVRNDAEVIANAMLVREVVGDEETLHLIAPVYGWDDAHIQQILASKQAQTSRALAALANSTPNFGAFGGGFDAANGVAAEMSRV
jgi:hypothetical protein